MEKECFKCGVIKHINCFYKHNKMADGRLNKCKECAKNDVKNHRSENIEKVREYDRNRPNHKERVENNIKRIKNDPITYQKYIEKKKEWDKRNRVKRNAHQKIARAVLKGIIKREYICSKCGSDIKIEAHHEDYSKPLDVIWLCSKCHYERHVEIRNEKRGAI